MTIETPVEDDVSQLAQRVERARGRLAYQFDPALTDALSEDELRAERELAERIREQDREQRWKHTQAMAQASDRARQTTEAIEKADMRDLLLARKAMAAQRRESSPHAKLASLYRHRSWSLRALAGVVGAGMLWSAVNVQHNIAPGGPSDPLYWFSYLLEAMISVCLIIIMVGTNKVAEWGVIDNRRQVAMAEIALLGLTVTLNTYPYVRDGRWYDAAVHAVAPVMIGVALLIHDAASARYGLAITRATSQVRDMPDPAENILNRQATEGVRLTYQPPMTGQARAEAYAAEQAAVAAPPVTREPAWTPTEPIANGNGKPTEKRKRFGIGKPSSSDKAKKSVAPAPAPEPVKEAAAPAEPAAKPADSVPAARKSTISDIEARVEKAFAEANFGYEAIEPVNIYDTGQFRIAESLEQELAEMREARRQARKERAGS
ncbi:hypothetical protein FEK33_24470 [Nocardia asteroides NBRC 15531]|uniref:DUF2637 domain-containing protein n=1 Tax=Nocardia asteroides NBRC 15531 TaxID=1110697 RepID=U5EP72_NOCAS|nr:hypothetical protein [Nocardia asteroides]TLF63223.1 hypothetical protein FEK33_24470 [Nocardia asteroides NBRC 15531]UGT47374.1 FUSC family protein [Nocardia asteroides]SFN78849.1 hypothetical protein SAMN05444423_11418 [Nocardia asteroides]VEG33730.1 Uncharacterised protein [Nocardia asteroides]GAD86889.1 hypothetical protein NCAST_34_00160 [Nocardia asteroides NBRC 15531]